MAFNKDKCLKITALEDDCVIRLTNYYFTKNDDDTDWVGETITLQKDESAYVKGTHYPSIVFKSLAFNISKQYKISGSIMSLVDDGAGEATEAADVGGMSFMGLFSDNVNLVDISDLKLSATILGNSCYSKMFKGCTGLTSIPEDLLPVTTLVTSCYNNMFEGCTGLTSLPKRLLPATTLASECYKEMFKDCSNLNEVYVPFTDWNESGNSTTNWLSGVAATGDFYCPKTLPQTSGASYIPNGWNINRPKPSSNELGVISGYLGISCAILKK